MVGYMPSVCAESAFFLRTIAFSHDQPFVGCFKISFAKLLDRHGFSSLNCSILYRVLSSCHFTECHYSELACFTKARILQAVRESVCDRDAERIAHLKKSEMAEEAERLLADSGWLAEPLRMNGDDIEVTETDEIDTEPKADDDEDHPVAAE